MYHGFDYARGLEGTPHERLVVLAEAIEWILTRQHEAAAREKSEDGKRRENRRYQDAVLALSRLLNDEIRSRSKNECRRARSRDTTPTPSARLKCCKS
jgi:hypothetical protein